MQIFPIDISADKTIGHLKEVVLEKLKNQLPDIDSTSLELWKVNIPLANQAEAEAKIRDLKFEANTDDEQMLLSFEDVGEYFNNPPKKHLHIIVRPPSGKEIYQNKYTCFLDLISTIVSCALNTRNISLYVRYVVLLSSVILNVIIDAFIYLSSYIRHTYGCRSEGGRGEAYRLVIE